MAKKKVDEITLIRQKALSSGRVVVTNQKVDRKLRRQLLKNYGLVVKKNN